MSEYSGFEPTNKENYFFISYHSRYVYAEKKYIGRIAGAQAKDRKRSLPRSR